jgi:sugar-specific transcriptional regulator TrmB
MVFQTELKKLGLKDKESAVYLACLELGPSPVQQISRKAKVVRATTYVVLDALMERGLVTHYKEGKKTLFSAEPPRQLMRLLEKQEEVIEDKKHDLEKLLPELQVITKAGGDRPSVRYFSGKEGLHAMRQEIVMYAKAGEMIYNFTPVEHLQGVFPQEDDSFAKQRVAKKVRSKTIFSTQSLKLRELFLAEAQHELSERRYVPMQLFPSHSGMTIFGDRIAIGAFTGKLGGVIIESSIMSDMMRRLFELAWLGAETLDE